MVAQYSEPAICNVPLWWMQIEGEVEYREDGALPNSSSSLFFFSDEYFEDYLGSPVTLGALGLVTDEPTVTRVSTETPVNVSAKTPRMMSHAFILVLRVHATLGMRFGSPICAW